MTRLLSSTLATVLALGMVVSVYTSETLGAVTEHCEGRGAVVCSIDEERNTVMAVDSVGFLWEFEGVDDWAVGDGVCLILWDNNTPETILDDVIVGTGFYRLDILSSYDFSD